MCALIFQKKLTTIDTRADVAAPKRNIHIHVGALMLNR